jgi:hypothetical protein
MYNEVYSHLVTSGLAVKHAEPVWRNETGDVVPCEKDAFGLKSAYELIHPEWLVFVDEVGSNTSQAKDGAVGGQTYLCTKDGRPQQRAATKDCHFMVLGFTAANGENFWVDRGWVAAGPNAATPPVVEPISNENLEITARIRSENLSRQLQGSFFVTRASSEKPESIAKLQGVDANPYYLDLLGSPNGQVKPLTEIELPELSNGPHYAYGIQWLAFALLALIGRFLLFREAKRLSLVKLEI